MSVSYESEGKPGFSPKTCQLAPFTEEASDVFVERPDHDFHYKTLSWQFVSLLMIAEIVSNGMLSLPSSLAVVGIVPAVILIIFLGIFGLFTAKLLIDFKLNHPSVHNMGDAGFILGGPLAREVLSLGTIIFAICGTGSELLSGQQALSTLSNNGLCAMYILLIFSVATLIVALPRTLHRLSWLGLFSVCLIAVAGIVGMIGAGLNPTPSRSLHATITTSFSQGFLAITNPVFSYAGKPLDESIDDFQNPSLWVWCAFVRTFHVFHLNLRDATSGGCNEGCLVPPRLCDGILYSFRYRNVCLYRRHRCITRLSVPASQVGQSFLWHCSRKFPDSWWPLLSYSCETPLCSLLQTLQAYVHSHCARLVCVVYFLSRFGGYRIRPRYCRAHILVLDRHCGCRLRLMVHLRSCWVLLATRHILSEGRILGITSSADNADPCGADHTCWWFHMRLRHVCGNQTHP